MPATELHAFNSADWMFDNSFMVQLQDPGEFYTGPCPYYLIDHPEGLVAFDTGVSAEMISDPESYGTFGAPQMVEFSAAVQTGEDRMPAAQLPDAGYDPEDVDYVVLSHLHVDHAGNITDFPNAEFLVQRDELQYAWWPDTVQQMFYLEGDIRRLKTHEYTVNALEGEFDVFGDGSVVAFPTPGHTPGHQSLQVELPDAGTVILGADIAHQQAGLENELAMVANWSLEETLASMRKVRARARKSDASVYVSHEQEHMEALADGGLA